MGIYEWIFTILVVIYGGLTIYVAYSQLKKEKIPVTSGFLMVIGGFLIILSAGRDTVLSSYSLIILVLGLVLIHISAIENGKHLYGEINIKHHIVRFLISILLIIIALLR
jgi:hypothetical protein